MGGQVRRPGLGFLTCAKPFSGLARVLNEPPLKPCMQMLRDKSGSVQLLVWPRRRLEEVSARGEVCVCVCLGGGWCVFMQVQTEEERRGGEEEQQQQQWMYSAVIHKVESTTKLLATV